MINRTFKISPLNVPERDIYQGLKTFINLTVVDFYFSLGFKKINDRFFEAGIPHWKMVKK